MRLQIFLRNEVETIDVIVLRVTKNLADRESLTKDLNILSRGKDRYMTVEQNVFVNSSIIFEPYAVFAT